MGFRFRSCFEMLACVLLWGCIGVRAEVGDAVLTVMVNDSAHVDPWVLREAEEEAGRIFHAAGIEISWVKCESESKASPCRRPPAWNEFVVHIVMSGKTSKDSVFGEAFLGENGVGNYCDVFFERIKREVQGSNVGIEQLLGSVAAHELGHLLLGRHSHSRWGIMKPRWQKEELLEIGMGRLRFTADDSQLMKSRMGPVKLTTATVLRRTEY